MIVAEISDWGLLIGRLHPLIVHLPIGILFIAVLFELLSLFKRYASLKENTIIIWLTTSITSVVACIAGYLLSQESAYDENTLFLHQWSGISLAVLATAIFFLKQGNYIQSKGSLTLSGILLVLLTVTGHQGGTLTHGDDYLAEPIALIMGQEPESNYVPPPRVKITDPEHAVLYTDLVLPLMEQKCNRCHNSKKSKGDLDLSDYSSLLKGGKGGKVLVSGSTVNSELYKRLILPKSDKKHMPPRSKDQLSEEEIKLIGWWIKEGKADQKIRVSDLEKNDSVKTMLASFAHHQDDNLVNVKENEFAEITVDTLSEDELIPLRLAGLVVTRLSPGSSMLSINCVNVPSFNDDQLKLLEPVKDQIVWLKAGSTLLSDRGMKEISQLKNLTRLNLENTSVSAPGLAELVTLTQLQYLNLVGTKVDDSAIPRFAEMEKLKRLHVWQSRISDNGVIRVKALLPLAEINAGE